MTSKKLPDFLVIGAGKSGTTSLDNYLKQHPEVYMCPVKEPNFFAYENLKRGDFKRPEDIRHFEKSVVELSAYSQLFDGAESYSAVGEVSNTYLYHPQSIKSIKKHLSTDVKLIAILRQPADRLFSRYMHLLRINALPSENFEDIFDKDNVWWERPDLVNEGFYYRHLKKYFDNFPSHQIKIFFYDDLRDNTSRLMRELFTFINVNHEFTPENTQIVYNKSGHVKSNMLNKIVGANGWMVSTLKKMSPQLVSKLKNIDLIKNNLVKLRNSNLTPSKLSDDMKKKITKEIYLEDIKSLEKLLNKDLTHWYTF